MQETVELHGDDFFGHERLPLRVIRRDPQPEYPLHTHDFAEMFIVLAGEGTHVNESGSWRLKRGDVFVINENRSHGFREIDGLCLVNILFSFGRMGLPEFGIRKSTGFNALFTVAPVLGNGNEGRSPQLSLDEIQLAEAVDLATRIGEQSAKEEEVSQFMAAGLFMQLVAFLSGAFSGAPSRESGEMYRLARVISYMENNCDRSISSAELLDIAGTSESTLLRLFKRITEESPIRYHLEKRIEKSCWYLRHTDRAITDIPYDFGFDDSNYFSRQFRKIKGISPAQWRRESRAR
jgi:AraC-like DNA-binding protein